MGCGPGDHAGRDLRVLLIDSSVWIEVLRGRLSLQDIPDQDPWATTEPVMLEVLAGALRFEEVSTRLHALPIRSVRPTTDYLNAAGLFRAARRQGQTIQSLTDCLIAAIAIRGGDTVVHRDADFEALTQVSDLRTIDLR